MIKRNQGTENTKALGVRNYSHFMSKIKTSENTHNISISSGGGGNTNKRIQRSFGDNANSSYS